ncbi:MAG: NAD-dependent epimerase/dehydratase family protein [Acidimicrobiia bacterium]
MTGGCGFIGVNLARVLRAAGYEPVAYDNLSTGRLGDGNAAGYAEVIEADVLDAESLTAAATGVHGVVHLAARTGVVDSVHDPRGDLDVNVGGTLNALLAARDGGASAFVFASSGAPLGSADPPGHEGLAPRPLSPYGASKLAGEGLCSAFAGSYGLPSTALRFTNVYGPFSYHKGSVIAAFMKRIIEGEPLVVYGDGSQTRDFLFVDDLCDAVVAVLDRRPPDALYQLGTGIETSVNELVDQLGATFPEREIAIRYEPARPGEIARSYSDISRAREALGFNPSVGLAEGLSLTRDWFVNAPRA